MKAVLGIQFVRKISGGGLLFGHPVHKAGHQIRMSMLSHSSKASLCDVYECFGLGQLTVISGR